MGMFLCDTPGFVILKCHLGFGFTIITIFICNKCGQPYILGTWCNCYMNRFLEEIKIIGYHKKPNKLSKKERIRFMHYGICPNCKQLRINYVCNKCNKVY